MHLQTLNITGFKSFARPTTFYFDQGLTAIIGPNGSGKSNVAEAIRWVLGEQSLKELRSQQSTDVLFSGGASERPANIAKVTLTFSNRTQRFLIDSAEVSIARTLNRSGESQYLINGDPVRLLDLQQLLAAAQIGTKSYTVISQGMVDRYVTASPSQRRELFDEATGIKSLQLKVRQAERKLEHVNTQASSLHLLVEELVTSVRVLARQAAQAQERASTQAKYQELQATWFSQSWHRLHQTITKYETDLQQTNAYVAKARVERETLDNALLAAAQEALPSTPAKKNIRQILHRCYELLITIKQHSPINKTELDNLVKELQDTLNKPVPVQITKTDPEKLRSVRENELQAERRSSSLQTALEQTRTELGTIENEILRERGTKFLTDLQKYTPDENEVQIKRLEVDQIAARVTALEELNPLIQKEYEEASIRLSQLQSELSDIEKTQQQLKILIANLRRQITRQFNSQFTQISEKFSHYFNRLFEGGTASLKIIEEMEINPEDPQATNIITTGIELYAHPPTKKLHHVHALSGGEKALTSLALLLAILDIQQPPFLVLDEVDAPLDEANSYRLAQILQERSVSTQCIVITHNRETMAVAHSLFGIAIQPTGGSQVYSVKLDQIHSEEEMQPI